MGYLNSIKITKVNILYNQLIGYSMFDDTKCKSCDIFQPCDGGCTWKRIQDGMNHKKKNLCSVCINYLDRFLETHDTMGLKSKAKKSI